MLEKKPAGVRSNDPSNYIKKLITCT